MLKIESGVPLPSARSYRGRFPDYREMKPGDSVLFPPEQHKTAYNFAAYASRRTEPGSFAARKVADGCRVWRVK